MVTVYDTVHEVPFSIPSQKIGLWNVFEMNFVLNGMQKTLTQSISSLM